MQRTSTMRASIFPGPTQVGRICASTIVTQRIDPMVFFW